MKTTPVAEGQRIRLDYMGDDPEPIPLGTAGTVVLVCKLDHWTQVWVDWDNGRQLALTCPPDRFTILGDRNDTEGNSNR